MGGGEIKTDVDPEHASRSTDEMLPGTGVSADAWNQFHRRMQLRREATCVAAVRRAMDGGDYRAALERARELADIDSTWTEIEQFLEDVVNKAASAPAVKPQASNAAQIGTQIQARTQLQTPRAAAPSAPTTAVVSPPANRLTATLEAAPRPRRGRVALVVVLALVVATLAGWTFARVLPVAGAGRWLASIGAHAGSEVPPAPTAPDPNRDLLAEVPQPPPAGIAEPAPPLSGNDGAENEISQNRKIGGEPATPQPRTPAATSPPSFPSPQTAASSPSVASSASPTAVSPQPPQTPPPLLRMPDMTTRIEIPVVRQETTAREAAGPPSGSLQPVSPPAATESSPPPRPLETTREASSPAIGTPPPDARAASAVADTEPDRRAINATLGAYARGYSELNADVVKRVWPAVNEEALGNAFGQLSSQRVAFAACSIDVEGLHASAICRGTARYVPRVGNGDPVNMSRVWQFSLRKRVDTWIIESATTR